MISILKTKTSRRNTPELADLFNFLKNKNNSEFNSRIFTFLNPYTYLIGRKNPELYNKFNHIFIDGMLLVKFLNFFSVSDCERKSFDMTSIAPFVFEQAANNKLSVYFIGAKDDIVDKSIDNIKNKFPGLKISGFRNGYFFDNNEKIRVIKNITALNPDIVITGMGAPLQEEFLIELLNNNWSGIGFSCGGFIHQAAKKLYYYPHFVDKFSLRWLYRIYDEPYLFKRYFLEYPKFIFIFLYDLLKNHFNKGIEKKI